MTLSAVSAFLSMVVTALAAVWFVILVAGLVYLVFCIGVYAFLIISLQIQISYEKYTGRDWETRLPIETQSRRTRVQETRVPSSARHQASPSSSRQPTRTIDRPVSRPSVPATVTEQAALTTRPTSYVVPASSSSLPVDAFLDLVETGDVRPLSEAYLLTRQEGLAAAARQRSATPPRLLDHLAAALQRVGQPRPLSDYAPCQQVEVVLHELTRLYGQANAVIKAKDGLTNTVIQHSNRRLDYQLEKVKREAAIAEQQAAKAKHELAARASDFEQAVKRRVEEEVAAVSTQPAVTAPDQAHAQRAEVEAQHHARDAQRADQLAEAQHRRDLEALNTEIAQQLHQQRVDEERLKRRLAGVRDPEATRQQREQQQEQRADIERREQFESQARAKMRRTKDKHATLDEIQRESDAHLAQVAETHGEDSDAYEHLASVYDELLRELRDEVNA